MALDIVSEFSLYYEPIIHMTQMNRLWPFGCCFIFEQGTNQYSSSTFFYVYFDPLVTVLCPALYRQGA